MVDVKKQLPRDVFMYLLALITLVVSAVSFGIVLFQLINVRFPDILQDAGFAQPSYALGSLRAALAMLVVVFPVFIWVSRFLKRDVLANPEKREFRVRRWMLYLTVFAAALVLIGDVVAIVRNYLEGELTLRFLLKVVAVFFIAGSVFQYYRNELKDVIETVKYRMGVFPKVLIVLVAAAVVTGFWVAGSPQSQRALRLDERRISDLQNIQWQVISYWQLKQALPKNLDALTNEISGFTAPRDPQTGESYEYQAIGPLSFQLCADFTTEGQSADSVFPKPVALSPETPALYGDTFAWQHGAEHTCFDRTIDPDLYKLPK